jgi:hypothetical protein
MIYVIILGVWIATVAGAFFYGHHDGDKEGFARGHAEYTNLLSQYQTAAAKQAQQTATVTTKQMEVSTDASTKHDSVIAAVRARYGVRKPAASVAGGSYVPPIPVTASQPDAAPAQLSAPVACNVEWAAEDAATLADLQGWVRDQQKANP